MKMRNTIWLMVVVIGLLVSASLASAAVTTLPDDTSASVTFTATPSEQATVTVPGTVTFDVVNVGAATNSVESVTVDSIVLTSGNALKISLKAAAAAFTAATGGSVTWEDGDVSWNAATWTNGTGAAGPGTLNPTTDTLVATSTANAPNCSSTNLTFTLAAKSTVDRAGNHTLACTWKFESFTPS